MLTSASPILHHHSRMDDLIGWPRSTNPEIHLKALREFKKQIIGNRTKKLLFLKLGAVPAVVSVLSSIASAQVGREVHDSLVIRSAAAIGSFSCDFDVSVKVVLEARAFPLLLCLISHSYDKVVMIFLHLHFSNTSNCFHLIL
nr:armadillo repeat-containing protein 8 isoform X1 [Ipomoea batatas]